MIVEAKKPANACEGWGAARCVPRRGLLPDTSNHPTPTFRNAVGNVVIPKLLHRQKPVFIGFDGLPRKVILSKKKGNVVVSD